MSNPNIPGSFFFDVLGSQQFQEALTGGAQEAIATQNIQSGIERFNEIAEKNGLITNAVFALILELARLLINWAFEQDRKNRSSA